MHNHARQAELKLEKKWITNDGYFRIFTTILGITVIDSMKAYKHHLNYRAKDRKMSVLEFAEELALEMLTNDFSSLSPSETCFNISPIHHLSTGASSSPQRRTSPRRINMIHVNPSDSAVSSLGMASLGGRRETAEQIEARIKMEHGLEKRQGTTLDGGKERVKRSKCAVCYKKSTWVCKGCDNICLCKGTCSEKHVHKFTIKELKRARYLH